MTNKEEVGRRLKAAREAAGYKTAKAAAEALGISEITYVQHENGIRGINRAAPLYARRFRVTLDWLLRGRNASKLDDYQDNAKSELTTVNNSIRMIPVTGRVSANNWLSVDEMDFTYDDIEYVPSLSDYPITSQFALKVAGNCLNKIARNGDTLICVNVTAEADGIKPDDLVIVERTKFDGQMVERTAKRVRQTSTGYELWPESNDPAHQEPIRLDNVPEGVTIQIIGKVLWIVRKP